jgi:hypothetical protein
MLGNARRIITFVFLIRKFPTACRPGIFHSTAVNIREHQIHWGSQMRSAFIDSLYRQAMRHRRAIVLYLCVLSASMGLAASVSAIVPPRAQINACGEINGAQCTYANLSHKR